MDHLAAAGDPVRRTELSTAAAQGRLSVASVDGSAVGYTVRAAWFIGEQFLELLYVASGARRQGIGRLLLLDFEARHGPRLFTSTNRSNAAMQPLPEREGWTVGGQLEGLDEGDPEVFFMKGATPT